VLKKRDNFSFWFLLLALVVLNIIIQFSLIKNCDPSWLLRVGVKMLHGKHYYYDFFETNPPMIIYLYMPAIGMAKLFHTEMYTQFIFYITIVTAILFLISRFYIKKIAPDNKLLQYILLIVLAVYYTALSTIAFGEREFFMLILTMPYILLTVLRGTNKPINNYQAIFIGLLAGIGISLKPYFLAAPLLIECYLMLSKRRFFYWFRTETLTIGVFLIAYLISIFIFTPEYIYKVLPLVTNLYFHGYRSFLPLVIYNPSTLFWAMVLWLYIFKTRPLINKTLINILLLASIGFLFSYLIQCATWYYRVYPLLCVTSFLLAALFYEYYMQAYKNVWKRRATLTCIVAFYFFPFAAALPTLSIPMNHLININQVKLVQHVKQNYKNKSIYVISASMSNTTLLEDYAGAKSVSRFPFQMLLPGLIKKLDETKNSAKLNKLKSELHEIIGLIVEDIQKNKPKLLIIRTNIPKDFFGRENFDYVKFLSQDPRFKKTISNYTYYKTINNFQLYILITNEF
jgi:hypothetical protein